MMTAFVPISASVVGATVYESGKLVAKNRNVTLPTITPVVAEVNAGGTLEAPLPGQTDAMDLSITSGGADDGLAQLSVPGTKDIEIRFAQQVVYNDGSQRTVGCKAFLKCWPKEFGGISIEVGSAPESESTFSVIRYQLFADGVEYWCIDKLNGVFRFLGEDYASDLTALL